MEKDKTATVGIWAHTHQSPPARAPLSKVLPGARHVLEEGQLPAHRGSFLHTAQGPHPRRPEETQG